MAIVKTSVTGRIFFKNEQRSTPPDAFQKKNESVQEYFLVMRELANRGNVEVESLIQYIIDGIPDELNNKIVLSGATNIAEFKKKLGI